MAGRVVVTGAKGVAKQAVRRRRVLRAPLKISELAAGQIKDILSSREDAFGVRLGVRTREFTVRFPYSNIPFSFLSWSTSRNMY